MMNTKEIYLRYFQVPDQGKPPGIFLETVDFGKFVMSNYGKYLGINRKMKKTYQIVCHRRNAKPSACMRASSLNTQEWSS